MRRTFGFLVLGSMAFLLGCSDDTVARDLGPSGDKAITTSEGGSGDGQTVKPDGPTTCQSTRKVEEFRPAPGSISGWLEDESKGVGIEAAYTDDEIMNGLSINGHHEPFRQKTDGFVQEFYKKGTATLSLYLWDLKTIQFAKDLFASQKAKDVTNGRVFEVIPGVKDLAEMAWDGDWRVWGYKCDYIYEITAADLQGTKDALKPEVVTFVTELTKGLP